MIATPPKVTDKNPLVTVSEKHSDKFNEYIEWFSPVDPNKGRYLHYDSIKYRISKSLDLDLVWAIVKQARARRKSILMFPGEPPQPCGFFLSPTIQRAISETDRNTTTAALEWMMAKIGEQEHYQYLFKDLSEDEAISSSQLEGAATTTNVARELLKTQRKARTPDEKMIVGNLRMMNFAWENRDRDLSIDLICELHEAGVAGIDDDRYYPGILKNSDEVKVVDAENNVVHSPPSVNGLVDRLNQICQWVNICHDDPEHNEYIHPLVKAIILHFCIGFEHPFRDGNGRVARSLFYWFMFKNNFSAFRFISISVLLKKAAAQYGKSYLYTETDQMDLTYFIEHQAGIIIRAISSFISSYKKTLRSIEEFSVFLWKSKLYDKLSDKQKIVLQVARSGVEKEFTTGLVEKNLRCSYNTAAKILNGLVDLKIFTKYKKGKVWIFEMLKPEKIMDGWSKQ